MAIAKNPDYKRIATEEAWAPTHIIERFQKLVGTIGDPGFDSLWGFYSTSPSQRAQQVFARLQDLGERRLADMDACGIDVAVLSLTSPGVQCFDAATATSLARVANDELAEACRQRPDRFAAVASFGPLEPANAAKEIERAVSQLGMKGAIFNSHTHGQYLSDPKFWDIFAVCEQLQVPLYLHPQTPPPAMIKPFLEAGLDGAVFGFGVETGLHMLRILTSGVFDRFPKLQMCIGHMGEALPYWMYRLDYMHGVTVRSKRYECLQPLQRRISDYLKENVYVTSSGYGWEPAIRFAQQELGVDRVLYAMDYPYEYEADEVRALDSMNIPLADKKKFFQTNAERIFRL
ncbi:amidohydrolase family protein [Steroidobacter sp.]|uniref:amidohydrolase family protein n=1 Tax=Steroidobacter sp. TaxID=1978227 RepID=UPI001A4FED95|nr:amidohydrolase family protein [Steroidobacter sp.]MBL8266426.1 amidohydrolase [Steroidobacter sp.]